MFFVQKLDVGDFNVLQKQTQNLTVYDKNMLNIESMLLILV